MGYPLEGASAIEQLCHGNYDYEKNDFVLRLRLQAKCFKDLTMALFTCSGLYFTIDPAGGLMATVNQPQRSK